MPTQSDLRIKIDDVASKIDKHFEQYLNDQNIESAKLKEAIAYSVLSGGKRMRPVLLTLVGELLSLNSKDMILCSLAIELMHAYSLVHDDLPAMDDDDLRRGKPTCHKRFDEATAILVGDALQCMAFELLASGEISEKNESKRILLVRVLAKCSGVQGMVCGQSLDLSATNEQITIDELRRLHSLKTGALLTASVELPCLLSDTIAQSDIARLLEFSRHIGLAFQIQDDILDVTSDTATLGKPQGSDEKANKSTFVSLLGLDGAKNELKYHHEEASRALSCLPYDTSKLSLFSDFLVTRTF